MTEAMAPLMEEEKFHPSILVFSCNWCSYAGADLAGVSRLQYPVNVKVLRVMCSGRVDPYFVLRALELGADGVLVTGCEIGDCHYISGNVKAKERFERLSKLLDQIGIGSERIRLEWIAASEGTKFAKVMEEFTDQITKLGPNPLNVDQTQEKIGRIDKEKVKQLISDTGAHDCVECGKCTTVCPVTRFNPEFAPRLVVVKALAGEDMDLSKSSDIWICNTCEMCNSMCPYEVDYSGFIRGMRGEARREGHEPDCTQGGLLHATMRIMANSDLPQNRLDWITDGLRVAEKGDVFLFVGCLPQMDTIFEDRNLNLVETARSAVRIMNHMGIDPVVSPNEKCCGHDLNWAGDERNLVKLMNHNVQVIKDSGAKTVVFTCPECMRTFNFDYQDFLGDFEFEMLHISEFISRAIEEGKLKFPENTSISTTFHDSCRLGRHLGLYDEPRKVLGEIPSVELVELEKNRDAATCCGVSGFMNCSSISKVMQIEKMQDAKRTGADLLAVPCPKCQIHLDCSVRDEIPVDRDLINIPIMDFTVLVDLALRGELHIPEAQDKEAEKEDEKPDQRRGND